VALYVIMREQDVSNVEECERCKVAGIGHVWKIKTEMRPHCKKKAGDERGVGQDELG